MKLILPEEFLNQYRLEQAPLSTLGEFVYLRTYARYLDDKRRRENWFETVLRATEYNINLGIRYKEKHNQSIDLAKEEEEAKRLFQNLFYLRTFPSGRTLYMGGTEVVENYPLSNYNCSFTDLLSFHDLVDVFYLLMVGSGVGVRIDKKRMEQFPSVRKVNMESKYDSLVRSVTSKDEMEHTKLEQKDEDEGKVRIVVGDSKEGWCEALELYFELVTLEEYAQISHITIDYSYVRPEGERLKRFGGRASGHKSIQKMFEKIHMVLNNREDGFLKTIDLLDIATIISENVVSGGVRRSAMMIICDEDDEEVINAKKNLYKVVDGNWIEDGTISHRKMSNNSVLYTKRPSLDKIRDIVNSIRINGEPGFINGEEARRRKESFRGCNPCGEILLQSKQCCNLTTNNLTAFVKDEQLDLEDLKEILRLSTRTAIRMTLVDVELPEWNRVMQEDRIIGISLTGIMDMINKVKMSYKELGALLSELRNTVHEEGERYCKELKITTPKLMTTIKPEGSLSTLPCVSSGIHYSHSSYYVRRVRISASDPLYKMIRMQGCYPIHNEVGQSEEDCTVKVIEFPIMAPEGRTKYDVSAIEQLELYKITMDHWSDHNTSITVHVREQEWEEVVNWIYENFDSVVGITLLPLFEETYPLLPYEAISKEEYEQRLEQIRPIDYELLAMYDDAEDWEILDKECEGGACPVR